MTKREVLAVNRLFVCICLVVSLFGCATTPVNVDLSSRHAATARKAKVFIIITQDNIVADYSHSNTGAQFGLIGMALDTLEDSRTEKAMLNRVAPLRQATTDLDLGRDFVLALASYDIFDDPQNIQVIKNPDISNSEIEALVASANSPVVLLAPTYALDTTMHTLRVRTRIHLWADPKQNRTISQVAVYHSAPVSSDWSWRYAEAMIPTWTAQRARRYRAAYGEGIDESVKMIQLALMGETSDAPSLRDPAISQEHSALAGIVVRKSPNRDIVLYPDGDLYSISTGPTYDSLESRLPASAPGYGRVFFYRAAVQDDIRAIPPTIYVNGTRAGSFNTGTVFYKDFRPGEYKISLGFEGQFPGHAQSQSIIEKIRPVAVSITSGSTHFIKFDMGIIRSVKGDELKVVEHVNGDREIRPLRMFVD